ncbi:MAG TPA: helix-turn-helix domain-containing protein [Acidimicrobiia bacterium]|jgi:DNA-binding transcriptional ArsR family regulator|nr:helix-turn-helix domain-containing protein [Acidimicrobiia bacterium]
MATREIIHLDSRTIKVLAHPLRLRLLGLLRVEGPSTATELAERTGHNSGATSYHLRQLAEVGLVEEQPDMGNKRQRFWKASQHGMSWRDTEYDHDPDAHAAADWLTRHMHRQYGRWVDDWLDARSEWPAEWRDAADQSDFGVTVTADQLIEIQRRVREIYEEYDTDDPAEGAERVSLINYAIPRRAVRF